MRILFIRCKRRKYGQNNKRGRGSYGNYGNEVEIRDERESVVGDRHGEVPVSRDVFFENESEITDEDKKISAQAL
ncbi:MAG: hypothetical protein SOZ83_01695 [Sphaerochaetaceae bacterium]|nr:hypothetical protein [Sphaerochaetaceae bacterium]